MGSVQTAALPWTSALHNSVWLSNTNDQQASTVREPLIQVPGVTRQQTRETEKSKLVAGDVNIVITRTETMQYMFSGRGIKPGSNIRAKSANTWTLNTTLLNNPCMAHV